MNLAQKIAEFACSLEFEDIPDFTIGEAKRRLIDTIGCLMGGWLSEPAKIARRLAADVRTIDKGATLVGTRHLVPPELAAFANGTAIRYLDYNDTYLSKEPAHPSDNIAALLAIAEAFGLEGKDLIKGIIISYEVQCRLCDAFSIRKKGWDHVTYGAYSTAAGCGAMLGFDEETMVHALALSGVPNNALRQTRVGELSMWKACAFANASRNGVFATLLAYHGMTGPTGIFEGEMGFFNVVAQEKFNIPKFGGGNTPFMIHQTHIKKYPAEYHSQSAIEAVFEINKEHGRTFIPDEIQEVLVKTFSAGYEIIGAEPEKWNPKNRETADHSLPYITCAALVDGFIKKESFSEFRYTDSNLLSLVEKTKVIVEPEFDDLYPMAGIPTEVIVKLHDGSIYQNRVDAPSGHALNPMTDKEVVAKFYALTEPMLSPEVMEAISIEIDDLEQIPNLSAVFELLEV